MNAKCVDYKLGLRKSLMEIWRKRACVREIFYNMLYDGTPTNVTGGEKLAGPLSEREEIPRTTRWFRSVPFIINSNVHMAASD